MTERSRRVVLLIDYDNLQICAARDTPGRDLQLTPVVQLAQRYGTVILARAYAEWNLSTERLAVYKAGIEPAFAPVLRTESDRSGKSLADTVMVAEGMDMLWTLSPEVVVLATSDKDLIPLVRVAKQRGAFVVVLGSDFTAIPLREMADEHVTYRQLISEAGVRFATEAGPGRQPAALPEPARRRRDRNGRERATTAAPAPAPPPAAAPAAPTPAPAPAAGPTAEPVAPVIAPGLADADAQSSGRRRRRRGSRRRSDRVGLPGETSSGLEASPSPDMSEGEAAEITPTTPAPPDEEIAPVAERPTAEAPAEEPAPRERRRRTRRPVGDAVEAPTSASDQPEQGESAAAPTPKAREDDVVAAAPEAPAQSADIMPPPPDAAAANGTPSETEPAAAPKPRARRVASASRGRSRRP